MKASARRAAVLSCFVCLAVAACGRSDHASSNSRPAATPVPAPDVTLTAREKREWARLAPDRSAVPVLVYHGVGPKADFAYAADARFGVDVDDFARQMTLMKHAGYQTIGLQRFIDFVQGEQVRLPRRPLLLTFNPGRADSWTGADGILRKLGFNAVMFVDVGRVDAGDPEYLTWQELETMQASGRWNLQLQSGKDPVRIHYGPGPNDYGPAYAFKEPHETFDEWRKRVRSDIEWGEQTLARHVPAYRPLAIAPPFGSYGQNETNDQRIPRDLLGWLSGRYDAVFTEDVDARARPGSRQPLGRIQVTRSTASGVIHDNLLTGSP